jgi:ABC-2 type transport system ATP-binding protein
MLEKNAVIVHDLHKRYGSTLAVDGISFLVQQGEIFGMVGPNGSGKTTTIECIEGLRRPDAGELEVLGLDPQSDLRVLRESTGIQLQSSSLPNRMRVEEALDLFASFYPRVRDWHLLLEELGLEDKRRAYFSQLSGGQKQRLFLALALINLPELVFLDELTTGLDPQARRATWDLVREIRRQGTTVFLTTHFMDEAEQLCDRVAILDHGQIVALDKPQALISHLGMTCHISFRLNGYASPDPIQKQRELDRPVFIPARIGAIEGVQRVEGDGDEIRVYGNGDGLVGEVVLVLQEDHIPFQNLNVEQANLEDVFLALTGRAIRN